MTKQEIIKFFPNLKEESFEITSSSTKRYNCLAWALGDAERWWQPSVLGGYYWLPGVTFAWTLEAAHEIFQMHGFEKTSDQNHEPSYERVAVYASGTNLKHFARQLPNGEWTSKLGPEQDISHPTAEALEGNVYGKVVFLYKRKLRNVPE
jgi:hypothetical protein